MRNHCSISSWRDRRVKELETSANLIMLLSLRSHHFIAHPVSEPLHGSLHTMGIEGEGKVSEWAKLEPGMGVRLFDEGLGEKNYEFEKGWLFGIIRRPYGR